MLINIVNANKLNLIERITLKAKTLLKSCIYCYFCMCVCVCEREREREREGRERLTLINVV